MSATSDHAIGAMRVVHIRTGERDALCVRSKCARPPRAARMSWRGVQRRPGAKHPVMTRARVKSGAMIVTSYGCGSIALLKLASDMHHVQRLQRCFNLHGIAGAATLPRVVHHRTSRPRSIRLRPTDDLPWR